MDGRWENYKLMRAKRHQGHDAYDWWAFAVKSFPSFEQQLNIYMETYVCVFWFVNFAVELFGKVESILKGLNMILKWAYIYIKQPYTEIENQKVLLTNFHF